MIACTWIGSISSRFTSAAWLNISNKVGAGVLLTSDLWPLTGWVLVPPLQLNCFCMYVAAGWGSHSAYCEACGWDLGCNRRCMDAAVLNESDSEGWGRRSCCCSTCTLPLRAEPRLPRAWCGSLPLCAQKESDGNGDGPGLFLMRRAGTDKRSGLYFMTLPSDWFDH